MIEKLTVENLRGIRRGELDGLSPVSVLVGPNNSGKSTCLEAIEIVGVGADVKRIEACLSRRGTPAGWQQRVARVTGAPTVLAIDCDENERHATFFGAINDTLARLTREGFSMSAAGLLATPFGALGLAYANTVSTSGFDVRLVDVGTVRRARALEDAYTEIDQAGRLRAVIAALAASMPSLEDLRILKEGDDFLLHTFTKDGERIPTYLAGDGFKRLLELAAALADLPDGVVLLEEPECYQHPRYLRELVSLIRHAALGGTQVVLSTHSLELIDALLHADWPSNALFPTVHRLRLVDGELRATTLRRSLAIAALDDLAEDLRA